MHEQRDPTPFLSNLMEGEEIEVRAMNEVEWFNIKRRFTGRTEQHCSSILSDSRYTLWSCAWFLIEGMNYALELIGYKLELDAIYGPNDALIPEARAFDLTYIDTANQIESFVLVVKKL